MAFHTWRAFDVFHHAVKVAVLVLVHLQSSLDGLLHQLFLVNVRARLVGERFGDDVSLSAMVVTELRVVRTDGWQLVLHLLLTFVTNLAKHLWQVFPFEHIQNILSRSWLCITTVILVQNFPRLFVTQTGIHCKNFCRFHIFFCFYCLLLRYAPLLIAQRRAPGLLQFTRRCLIGMGRYTK